MRRTTPRSPGAKSTENCLGYRLWAFLAAGCQLQPWSDTTFTVFLRLIGKSHRLITQAVIELEHRREQGRLLAAKKADRRQPRQFSVDPAPKERGATRRTKAWLPRRKVSRGRSWPPRLPDAGHDRRRQLRHLYRYPTPAPIQLRQRAEVPQSEL